MRNHVRLLIIVTIAWILFWIAGLPDYYQQYSTKTMIIFDLLILPPIWFVVYRSVKGARPGWAVTAAAWWAFYISFPLFIYDFLYAGLYLGHGMKFLWHFWYLTLYYVLPWLLFPATGWFVEKRRLLSSTFRGQAYIKALEGCRTKES
jgi:hypothetical protein